MLLRLASAPVAVALVLLAVLVTAAPGANRGGALRLPDLQQELPASLVVIRAESSPGVTEYRLGFRSAVRNVGRGPLVIDGHRSGSDLTTMVADQAVERSGGPRERIRGVGRLRFVVSPSHRHWHLLGFERYELRRPGSGTALVEDRKTGFCLGDRYVARGRTVPPPSSPPVFTSSCGLGQTELLGIREGISVGYGDDYVANLEGQYLPLTGLRAGRYVLVHRVNVGRRIRELRYGNDAASLLLRLRWRLGVPYVRVLARCPGAATCRLGGAPRPD
jgi:Lysyl oxidase